MSDNRQCKAEVLVSDSTNRIITTKIETATLGSIMVSKGLVATTLRMIVTAQRITSIHLDKAVELLQNGRLTIGSQINTSDPSRTSASRRLSKDIHGTKVDVHHTPEGADRLGAEVRRIGVMGVIARIITVVTRRRSQVGRFPTPLWELDIKH